MMKNVLRHPLKAYLKIRKSGSNEMSLGYTLGPRTVFLFAGSSLLALNCLECYVETKNFSMFLANYL